MEPREDQSLLLLRTCDGKESQRVPGHEWCLGGARTAGKSQNGPEGAGQRTVLNAGEEEKQIQGTVPAHPGGKERFLPQDADAGHEGDLR